MPGYFTVLFDEDDDEIHRREHVRLSRAAQDARTWMNDADCTALYAQVQDSNGHIMWETRRVGPCKTTP